MLFPVDASHTRKMFACAPDMCVVVPATANLNNDEAYLLTLNIALSIRG